MTAQDTRERLLDVAQELIQRRGINGMSFQDLSDAVGIRKASVHHHFASKLDMVDALLDRYLLWFQGQLDAILGSGVTAKTKLKRYCNLFVATLESGDSDKGCLCGMLMAELLSLDESGRQKVQTFLRTNSKVIEMILAEGGEDGSLSAHFPTKTTARLVLAALEGGLLVARCEGGSKQLAEVAARLVQLLST